MGIDKYSNKDINLWCGDCLELLRDIEDGEVDLVLCDLPYGTTTNKWDTPIPLAELWGEYKRVVKDNGVIILFADQPFTSLLVSSNLENFVFDYIWKKSRVTGFLNVNKKPMKQTEDILIFSVSPNNRSSLPYYPQNLIPCSVKKMNSPKRMGQFYNNIDHLGENNCVLSNSSYEQKWTNYPKEILEFNSVAKPLHPTQKPVPLLSYLIKTFSKEKDLVLDNTMGSGSVAISCIDTDRKFIGIELKQEYFEIAVDRVGNHFNDYLFFL